MAICSNFPFPVSDSRAAEEWAFCDDSEVSGHKSTSIADQWPPQLHTGQWKVIVTVVCDSSLVHQVHLSMNNSLGELPFTTAGEVAQFRLPLELIWGSGQNLLWTISE